METLYPVADLSHTCTLIIVAINNYTHYHKFQSSKLCVSHWGGVNFYSYDLSQLTCRWPLMTIDVLHDELNVVLRILYVLGITGG